MAEAVAAISLRLDLPGGGWVEVAAASHPGPRRRNEDNFLIVLPDGTAWRLEGERLGRATAPRWRGDALRIGVLDGMGGHPLGLEIAEAATTALLAQPPQDSPESMRAMVIALHAELMARAGGPGIGGCTLVLIDINLGDPARAATLIHIGDSEAWFRHHSVTYRCVRPHRTVEFAYRDGEIGAEEYATGVQTKVNRLCQALGYGSFHAFSRAEEFLNPNLRIDMTGDVAMGHADVMRLVVGGDDLVLLGSDGLLAGGPPETLSTELADGADLALEVERIARSPAARDNTTAVMLRFGPER